MNIATLIADPHQVRVECIIAGEKIITVRITTGKRLESRWKMRENSD